MKVEDIPFGKRLVSEQAEVMYYDHPNSRDEKTLPAGKPSPIVDSFVFQDGGFYQLKEGDKNLYLKKSDRLKVVPEDAEDNSSFFGGLAYNVKDFFVNTDKDIAAPFYHFRKGVEQTAKDAKDWIPSTDDLKDIVLWIAVPIAGILFLMFLNNLSD